MAALNITMGTTHKDQCKNSVTMISGTIKSGQGVDAGGDALTATRLAEWLTVSDEPAHTRPDVDAHNELRFERPIRCPLSYRMESERVFLDPQIGQLQSSFMALPRAKDHKENGDEDNQGEP